MKRVMLSIAVLLTLAAPAAAGERWIVLLAFNGLSGGANWSGGWQKLFDVEDTVRKVACTAGWRDFDGNVTDKSIKVETKRVTVKALGTQEFRIIDYAPSRPEAATALGLTKGPRLTTSWGADAALWLWLACHSTRGAAVLGESRVAAGTAP